MSENVSGQPFRLITGDKIKALLLRLVFGRGRRILPDAGTAGRPLTAVIAVMCFLACLALGALIIINRSVDVWTSDVASQVTAQVKPVKGADTEAQIRDAVALLRATPGVSAATALEKSANAQLLEPWLGDSSLSEQLPLPRLIAVSIDRGRPPDFKALAAALQKAVPGASLDTHQRWQKQIRRTSNTLKLLGYGVLLLVSLTTVAIVVFATRAAMASNREVIEVLHLVGARDQFIAHEIQRHFLNLGLRAGAIGAIAGTASFITVKLLQSNPPPEIAASVEFLIGTAALGGIDYFLFLLIPIAAALISVVTARLATLRILGHVL